MASVRSQFERARHYVSKNWLWFAAGALFLSIIGKDKFIDFGTMSISVGGAGFIGLSIGIILFILGVVILFVPGLGPLGLALMGFSIFVGGGLAALSALVVLFTSSIPAMLVFFGLMLVAVLFKRRR